MKKRGFFLFTWEDIYKHWDVIDKDDPVAQHKFDFKQTLAMVIAAFSIVLPWVLAIMGSLTLVVFLVWKFYLKQ